MRLTRRQVLVGAATSGLGAAGLYELVDRLTGSPADRGHGRLQPEQHLLDGVAVMQDNGVAVVVPPLFAERVTPHTEAACAVVWHLLVSHPVLRRAQTMWESVVGGGRA